MTCFAYEKMFWQRSIEDYMKFCFKAIFLIIIHAVGEICVSSREEIIRLNLITTFWPIFLIAAKVEVMIQW